MYDSMLLSNGGGIIATSQQSEQFPGEASLIIGIGGTGVAAITRLKQDVFQRILPDDPDSSVPEYKKIRFLAIDSDDTVSRGNGKSKLLESEFVKIKESDLSKVFTDSKTKAQIKESPLYQWFDVDKIVAQLAPDGAGGVRAVGRYLFFKNANKIKAAITDACTDALKAAGTNALNIYICAGISGGTGSGCFLDTCYIVRQIIEEKAWAGSAKVMGFFFLPDVVISKLDSSNYGSISYNQSNGYAAMKELDYLMNMQDSGARFSQNYGLFRVDTDLPPVDMCHLVSAQQSDGRIIPNGFNYSIHVVSDYILNYLANVEGASSDLNKQDDDLGLTIRGHLANVGKGVATLPVRHGANRLYHVVGASNGEIPMTQIATYLASGFYKRFLSRVGREKATETIDKTIVNQWAQKLGLQAQTVVTKVQSGCPAFSLPQIERKTLAQYGAMPKGKLPGPWGTVFNAFLDKCAGIRKQNSSALTQGLETFDYAKLMSTDASSFISSVYRLLYELCANPSYGPYYAAGLLHNGGYDLRSATDGVIKELEAQRDTQLLQLNGRSGTDGMEDALVQISSDYVHRSNSKNYKLYEDTVIRFGITQSRIGALDDSISTMRKLRFNLDKLYEGFFIPLLALLDNLRDTFIQNEEFLSSTKTKETTSYTWHILDLADVKEGLDVELAKLQDQGNVTDFMNYVLEGYDEWIGADEGRISLFISRFMEASFKTLIDRSLQDYLYQKFPQAQNETQLSQIIQKEIISKVYTGASAMFWCRSSYNIEDDEESYRTATITVPLQSSAVCTAAQDQSGNGFKGATIRKSGIKDRIFAMRFFSGIPFYAYQGVTSLWEAYQKSEGKTSGAGLHLYERTGRGEDGKVDWRYYLPAPTAYSMDPELFVNGEQLSALYDRGCALGVISQVVDPAGQLTSEWVVTRTKDLPEFNDRSVYYVVGKTGQSVLDEVRLERDVDTIRAQVENGWSLEYTEDRFPLKSNGDINLGTKVVDRVRKDHFMHSPFLQEIVRTELEKHDRLQEYLKFLEDLREEGAQRARDIRNFANLLFFDILICEDPQGFASHTKIAKIHYAYEDGNHAPCDQVFAKPGMDKLSQYPLYQAYLHYRSLEPGKLPRSAMDKKLAERLEENLSEKEGRIGRELELALGGERMNDMRESLSTKKDGEEILEFYNELLSEIYQFKEKFPFDMWNSKDTTGHVSSGQVAQPNSPLTWSVWTGTEYVTIYDNYGVGYGLSSATNPPTWIPLQQGWQIYWNGQWIPLILDAQNRPINLPR